MIDDPLSVSVTQAGADQGLAQTSGRYHYVKDGLGSVTEISDSSGNLVQRFLYSAFGLLLGIQDASAADITPAPKLETHYAFTGREYDSETGNYYYRARYYDPGVGRFLQQDPDPGNVEEAATIINRYSYAGNNPNSYVDPDGKLFFLIPIIAAIAGSAAGAAVAASVVSYLALTGVSAVLTGIVVGAITGGIVGGLLGSGLGYLEGILTGNDPDQLAREGLAAGAIGGAIGGGISGGFAGYAQGLRNAGYDRWNLKYDRWNLKYDRPGHNFRLFGKRYHFQLNVWKDGVSGSDLRFRVPTPNLPFIKPGQILP